jgi:DNA-binding transcriptional MerR regulator
VKDSPGRPGDPKPPAGDWIDVAHAGSDLTWGVGAVSSRLGVAPSTLRTWERRYGIGPTHRTHGGHRRYTERDINRVELVRRMVARGVSVQDAARVARHLDGEDLASALRGEGLASLDLGSDAVLDSVLAAATSGDVSHLRELVTALLGDTPVLEAWRDVLSPSLTRLAHEVSRGIVDRKAKDAAERVVLGALRDVRGRTTPPRGSGVRVQVLMATFVDEATTLPFVAWGAALVQADVVLQVVGPELDTREVLDLATRLEPAAVVAWGPPDESGALIRRHLDAGPAGAFLRARCGWPDELRLRFGLQEPEIATDVPGAVQQVLDRVR